MTTTELSRAQLLARDKVTLDRPYIAHAVGIPGKILAAEDGEDGRGTIRALVSAYNVRYRIGYATFHTIEPGAFADQIGDRLPMFWQHNWDWAERPPIGDAEAEESDDGLILDGVMYTDLGGDAAQVYAGLKSGALTQWSIGYRVLETRVDEDDDFHFFVTKGELLEGSSVLRGANPATDTLEVASHTDLPEDSGDEPAHIDMSRDWVRQLAGASRS